MQQLWGPAGSSLNYGYVNDPYYNKQLVKLEQEPLSQAQTGWAALDQYAVQKAYFAGFGHQASPKFFSNRLIFKTGVLSPAYGLDLTSLQLK